MAVSFPTSPSTGDTFDVGRVRYEWSGSAWKQIASQPVSTGAEIPFTKADGSTSDPIKLASTVIGDALVNDTTPQLGGNLDVNGNGLVSTSNANINITPNGSGKIVLDGISWPNADGSANQVLKTNGSGVLSWAADAAGTITALNNATENELVTVGATTTELDGEANLTFDGTSTLEVRGPAANFGVLTLSTAETTIVNTDPLGRLDFKAPLEGSGSNAVLPTVRIEARATETFDATHNQTDLLFLLANDGGVTEKMRMLSSGGLAFGGDTAAANALDDYEEGTWTATITFGGAATSVSYGSQTCYYTKIGNVVTISGLFALSNKGSSSGDAKIGGLPFTANSNTGAYAGTAAYVKNISFADVPAMIVAVNSTVILLEEVTNAGDATTLTNSNFDNNAEMFINLTYRVA